MIHDILVGLIVVEIILFTFNRFDEAFAFGIVVRISTPAHRSAKAPLGQHRPVRRRGILAAADALMFVKWQLGQ